MEDGDDDFGDLYADVEVEASCAMNVAPQCSQLLFVSDETIKRNSPLETSSDREDIVSDGDEDDDDDDDLNIVLNSDDDSTRHGEGLTIARTITNLRSGDLEDEDDHNFGTEEFGGGNAISNSHSLYKYSRSQSAAYGSELKGWGCGPQHGQRFSLPWSRSILDVNIDAFEQKPWKYPGADLTDYFNFGLNEVTWKLYCNQVDAYRHGGPVLTESPPSDPSQLMERKGRAIQVEDSLVERQSSMDVMPQMDRDSDVIQVTIMDQDENCCVSEKEGSGNDESCVPEASKSNHGDVSGSGDHLSFSSESDDESFEGNRMETEIDASKRVRRSSSKSVTQGSENHEIHQSSNEPIRTSDDTCTTEKSPPKFKDRWKSSSHERCSSTELTRSVKVKPTGYHHSHDLKRSNHHVYESDKRKHGDHRYNSRYHNSPVYNNRTHKDFKPKPKFHHENDDIIYSRRQDEKREHGDHRYDARRHCNHVYNHNRNYERMHHFDPYNEESMLYSKESEPPLDYYHGERFYGYEDYERFGSKTGRPVYRSIEEEEYYGEERRYRDEFDWNNKRMGNNVHFGNKEINDEFFVDREYFDDIKVENFRCYGYNGREKDEFEDEYARNVEYTRWEFRDSRRNKRRVESPCGDYLTKREESHNNMNNVRWHDDMAPRSSRYEGQMSERFRYNDFEPFDREEDYMIDYNGDVDLGRSGDHHWESEMQWRDDDIMMMPFGHDYFEESIEHDLHVKGDDYKFERRSNVEYEGRFEKRLRGSRDSDSYEWVFMGGVKSRVVDDDVNGDGCGYNNNTNNKDKREVISGKKFRKSYGESGKKLSPSCRNSRLGVRENKCSKNHNKAAKVIDKRLDIEEGQIVTETGPTKAATMARSNNGKTGLDKSRILEARAKMENRRARFNEGNGANKMDSDGTTTKVRVQEMGSNKPQRPARKRRWGGS